MRATGNLNYRRLSLFATLCIIASGLSWISWQGPWGCDGDFDQTKFALIGAAKITNPAYHVGGSGGYSYDSCREDLSLADKSRKITFSLQPLGYDARKAWLYVNAEFKLKLDGTIIAPQPVETHLSSILANPATFREVSTETVQATLKANPKARYSLIAGFKEGITWESYTKFVKDHTIDGRLSVTDVAFFSPLGTGPTRNGLLLRKATPIGWDWSPEVRKLMGRAGDPAGDQLGEFRYWVSKLDRAADPLLHSVGLDLTDLRRRANQGLVYGYLDLSPGKDQVKMLDSPMIAWARIIDTDPLS